MFKSDEIPHLGFKIHVTEISTNPFDVVPLVSSIVTKQFFFFFVFKILFFYDSFITYLDLATKKWVEPRHFLSQCDLRIMILKMLHIYVVLVKNNKCIPNVENLLVLLNDLLMFL